ncbi:MAG: hypothetical protein F9K17_02360, partial [Phycisphaerae bacterium]
MSIRKTAGVLLTFGLAASVVQADIVVTLRAVDGGGNEIVDPVPAGTEVFVDVLLSSSGVDNPLFNLRSLQFDFTDTGAGIVLSDFEWRLQDTGILSDALYFKDTTLFPGRVSADYANLEQDDDGDGDIDDDVDPRFIVALDGDPVRVARMTATVNDSDTIDATRRDTGDPNRTDQGVRFLARFTSPKTFRLPLGNVKGGALTIAVEGGATPDNDTCDTAIAVTDGSTEFDVVDATTEGFEEPGCDFCCNNAQLANDIWYSYTATCDGTLTIELCGSDADTRLAVYGETCPADSGETLACNDDACGLQSRVTLETTAGTAYLIRVGSFAGSLGKGALTITCSPDECAPGCPVENVGDGVCDPACNNADCNFDGGDCQGGGG